MPTDHRSQLRAIRTFPSLVHYLRDEMDWPISTDDFEDLTFDYTPEELGIDTANAAKIQEIKRLRPLSANQPWGIFFVKFEPKRLPVVALRRILSRVAVKKRASANSAERAAWQVDDLLFISNYGEGEKRQISFAHFAQDRQKYDLPTLKVLGWDNLDTDLHLDHVAEELREQLAWPEDEDAVEAWRESWRAAFTLRHREVITTSRALAEELAKLARSIRDRIRTVLAIETEDGPVTKLMVAFQESLINDLDEDSFADMYAQTIAYGLLSARVANPKGVTADDFTAQMPVTNPFLKELMQTFLDVGGRKGKAEGGTGIDFDELGVNEVVELLDDANMEAVVRDFGDRNPQEDPVIHFYELFLKEYDAKKRMQRGVFYTPRPVVSFIVRSVDELLRTEFGLEDGLADTTNWGEMTERHEEIEIPDGAKPREPFVQILDPATGTGTFLVEVIDLIYKTMTEKWKAQGRMELEFSNLWNEYVPKHLLPRLHGYELLMAPYAIAHMKIGLKLYETGYRFASDERARVYLTNSLEPAQDYADRLTFAIPALAHEAEEVNKIKRGQYFTIIIGNPPYSVVSANTGDWIVKLCEEYKVNVRHRERQIQALSDDYVKFLRLMQWNIDRVGFGVIGVITNNGFLDGHLFSDMRQSLIASFDETKVLNLHGNLRTKERTPDGEFDDNVFDIQTGVAITCLSKKPYSHTSRLQYRDLWGARAYKYSELGRLSIGNENWETLESQAGEIWMAVDSSIKSEWEHFISLLDIFGSGNRRRDAQKRYAAGFVSQQDEFAIGFSKKEMKQRVERLKLESTTESELRKEYRLCTTSQWSFSRAREELNREHTDQLLTTCTYRPFDRRWTAFHRGVVTILRKELMRHLFKKQNVALLATRGISRQVFYHAFVANDIVDRHALDNASESMFVFPLYIFPNSNIEESIGGLFGDSERYDNISVGFKDRLYAILDSDAAIPAEAILDFVYAVLHSPHYRSRYADFLSNDFPQIPLPKSSSLFHALVELGNELIGMHLLESPKLNAYITTVIGAGHTQVEKVTYSDQTVWIDKARTRGFRGVPEEVWDTYIGGYKVCEKWIKDRQAKGGKNPRPGRVLTDEDIDHYQTIIVALNETIRIMQQIDEVIEEHGGWPGAFLQKETVRSPTGPGPKSSPKRPEPATPLVKKKT